MRKSFNSSQDNHNPVQLAEQTPWCAGASWEQGERQPHACTLPHPSLLWAVHGLHCRPQYGVGALVLALALASPRVAPWLHEHSQACLSTSLCRKAAALGRGTMQSGAAGKGLLLLLLPQGPGGGQGGLGPGKRARSLLK